jgi:hypothetical protein
MILCNKRRNKVNIIQVVSMMRLRKLKLCLVPSEEYVLLSNLCGTQP